ncbi:MAG: FAD-dependent oxidoreductase, partial [Rubripirellula sp.]
TPESVGMGSYTLDSHNAQRYVTPEGTVQNEGDIGVKTPRPYKIAYGSITPKKSECTNLLVPVCVSSSHIAFGSIRMEPVFMILGQSAATAACLSIDREIAVQDLPYETLRARLVADNQVLELEDAYEIDSKKLSGVVIDDRRAQLEGVWKSSTSNKGFVNDGYRHNDNQPSASTHAIFETPLADGRYEVRLSYPPNRNRASNVPVSVSHAGGETQVKVNQRLTPTIDGTFVSLGQFQFSGTGRVKIDTHETDGHVIVDAIQFLPLEN